MLLLERSRKTAILQFTCSVMLHQLVSISSRKPSLGVMKIGPKRGDYIAKRCDMLNNDQFDEL